MIGLDTNVLVRYLAQDDKAQSALATRLVEGSLSQDQPGYIPAVVLAELVWVLESNYQLDREQIAELLEALFRTQQLKFEERDAASQALGDYRPGKADYVDCLIQHLAARAGCSHTVTFDRAAARLSGMRLLGG